MRTQPTGPANGVPEPGRGAGGVGVPAGSGERGAGGLLAEATTLDEWLGAGTDRVRAAEAALVALLAEDGFAGRRFEDFCNDLGAAAWPVLVAWIRSGEMFTKIAEKGRAVPEKMQRRIGDADGEDLANKTLERAFDLFRSRGMVGGGWRPDGGASLTTYFINACKLVFRDAYLAWARKDIARARHEAALDPPRVAEARIVGRRPVDPALQSAAWDEIMRELRRVDPDLAVAIVRHAVGGEPQADIARSMGITRKTLERRLAAAREHARRHRER